MYRIKNNFISDFIYYHAWNFLDYCNLNPKKDYRVLKYRYSEMLENTWGFECDIGWFDLLSDLLHNIKTKEPEIKIAQIKEKFGSLRFYPYSASGEVLDMIDVAEERSYKICERCGIEDDTVKTRNEGWLYTLCGNCHKNNN